MPGVQTDHHIYPTGGPDLAKARALMHGRDVQLTLWTCTTAACGQRAKIVRDDLAAIGITVHTRQLQDPYVGGNGYDIRDDSWPLAEYDPDEMLGADTFGRAGYWVPPPTSFTDPAWHRRVEQVARLDDHHGRFAAFGTLELRLMRTAAPWAAYAQTSEDLLLSTRIGAGCVIENPVYGLDLAALCLTADS